MKEPTPDADADILWDEEEDVYQPLPIDTKSFLRSLPLKRTPALRPGQSTVFIARDVYARIRAHLQSNLDVEQGGLLIGRACHDAARSSYLLLIEDALPVPEGVETATSFGYTPASWQTLLPQLRQMRPDQTLLGTYHSHPGLGVFLSSTDLETQAGAFAQEWQVALVIDPVADKMGFFLGEEGNPCYAWYVLEKE